MKKSLPANQAKSATIPSLRDKIDSVLGSPVFLTGDDEEQFSRLESALIAHVNPIDIFEEIWTREIVERLFEVQRLRRWKVRVLEIRERHALAQFIRINHGLPLGSGELISQWMARDPEAQKKMLDLVSPVDRSLEHIEANTVFFNLDALSALENLLQAAETRKDVGIKELELYRDRKAKRGAIEGGFKNVTSSEVANDQSPKG